MNAENILVTGAAGFIGFHLSSRLLEQGHTVTGIDSLNDYYDVGLKRARLELLKKFDRFDFQQINIANNSAVMELFGKHKFSFVVNLAAQAGVRYSLTNPHAYMESNLQGFLSILEACRHQAVKHLVYASSSSVYGANRKMPFSTRDNVDHPISLYAASKKANELMAHTYSALYGLPTTGLRFFSVYGPYGRPDMALFIFTKSILEGKPISVYNNGMMKRDFTYVDDVVEGITRLLPNIAQPNSAWNGMRPDPPTSFAPYRVFNIGNNRPVELMRFIEIIEEKLGRKAIREFAPIQEGDVPESCANVDDLAEAVGFRPETPIEKGIGSFVDWYLEYYRINS